MSKVALRYARALFEFAKVDNKIDEVLSDVLLLKKQISDERVIRNFLNSPLINNSTCVSIINALQIELGLTKSVQNFLLLLAQKRRLSYLESIVDIFIDLNEHSKKLMRGRVISARPIKVDKIEELKKTLGMRFKKDIFLESVVDEKILGGIVIDLGSYVFDGSFKTKLQSFKTLIKG